MAGQEIRHPVSCRGIIRFTWACSLVFLAGPAFSQSAVRNVSPPGVAVPHITAPLQRIERVRPQAARQSEAAALPERSFHIIRPLVLERAALKSGKLTVELAHVTGLPAAGTCETASGQVWPCGTRALTALRALVRSHRVDCEPAASLGPHHMSAICRKGPVDLGYWLVQQGWARASGEAPEGYTTAEAAAREAGLGQWQQADFQPLPQGTPIPDMPLIGMTGDAAPQRPAPIEILQDEGAPDQASSRAETPLIPAWENPFDVQDTGAETDSAPALHSLPQP